NMGENLVFIEKDVDWNERIPFEISVVFERQYCYNNENEYDEIQRFTICNFGDFETIVDRSFYTFSKDIIEGKFYSEHGKLLNNIDLHELYREYHRGLIAGYNDLNEIVKD